MSKKIYILPKSFSKSKNGVIFKAHSMVPSKYFYYCHTENILQLVP